MSFTVALDQSLSKEEQYQNLLSQLEALVNGEQDLIANLANVSAVLKQSFNYLWVGFYLLKNNELILGPFQGPVACTRITLGKGVCGESALKKKSLLVPNVHEFPGHIACSTLSQSELVVPILKGNEVLGVLDIDSEDLNHFDNEDQVFYEKVAHIIAKKWA